MPVKRNLEKFMKKVLNFGLIIFTLISVSNVNAAVLDFEGLEYSAANGGGALNNEDFTPLSELALTGDMGSISWGASWQSYFDTNDLSWYIDQAASPFVPNTFLVATGDMLELDFGQKVNLVSGVLIGPVDTNIEVPEKIIIVGYRNSAVVHAEEVNLVRSFSVTDLSGFEGIDYLAFQGYGEEMNKRFTLDNFAFNLSTPVTNPVPEPATTALMLCGLLVILFGIRRMKGNN